MVPEPARNMGCTCAMGYVDLVVLVESIVREGGVNKHHVHLAYCPHARQGGIGRVSAKTGSWNNPEQAKLQLSYITYMCNNEFRGQSVLS